MTPTEPPPLPTKPWEPATRFYRQVHVAALSLLILVLLVHVLEKFRDTLQQLLVAVFIVYLIMPAHRLLVSRGVPSLLAYALILLALAGATALLAGALWRNFEDFYGQLPTYRQQVVTAGARLAERLPWTDAELKGRIAASEAPALGYAVEAVRTLLEKFFGLLQQAFVVVVYLAFLVAERASFARRIAQAFPPQRARHVTEMIGRINNSIQNYILVKTLMSVLAGVLTWLVLTAFRVDYPAMWGLIAFLLNYIPYVGSAVALGLPVLLSLMQYGNPWWTAAVLASLLVVHGSIGLFVEPVLAGSRLNLSPLVILVALAFWGGVWGVTGMILAVPMVVVLRAVLDSADETRPFAVLMSNA